MKYKNIVLLLCLLAFFVTYFSRLAISPIVPLINEDLGVSNTQIGFALSGMWLAYGISQFPSGILADQYGEKSIILLSVGGTTLMTFLLAFSPNYFLFFISVFLLGGAAGFHYSVATSLLSQIHDQVGTVVGIHALGGPLAGLTAPVVTAWVGYRYGWQPAIMIGVLIGIPIFILFLKYVKPTNPQQSNDSAQGLVNKKILYDLLKNPAIISSLIIATAGVYIIQGVLSFLPTFLIDYQEYTPTQASIAFSAFFIIRAIGQILVGKLSDAFGTDITIICSMLLGFVGIILLITRGNILLIGTGIAMVGIGTSFIAAIDPKFINLIPDSHRGTGFGLVRTVYTMLGAAGSIGVGLFADLFGWNYSFGFLAFLFAFAILISILNRFTIQNKILYS